MRLALSVLLAALAAVPAVANDTASTERMRRVEAGLLPRVALKQDVGVTATIEQRLEALGIPGASIAVIDEGKIAWARAYGLSDNVEKTPVTTQTLFQAGSISKPVAALGALRLVKENKLTLDDDVNAKLTSWRVPENEFTKDDKVTLRRLASHTSGLTVHGFPGYAIGSPIPTVVQILRGEAPANTAAVRVDVRPGTRYRYSGGGYTVMQLLMADVAAETFESFMQTKVLDPLGMSASTYAQDMPAPLADRRASGHRPGGERIPGKLHIYPEMAAAGLWTTASDLARYLIYVQAALRGEGGAVLDEALARAHVERKPPAMHGVGPEVYEVGEFGRFGHGGVDEGFEASIVAYVGRGQGVVIMANANMANVFFDEVKGSVARAYAWPAFPTRTQLEAEPISKAMLERAPGKYQIGPGATSELRAEGSRLFLATPMRGRFEVFARNAQELFAPPLGSGTFELVDSDGKVTGIKTSEGAVFQRLE